MQPTPMPDAPAYDVFLSHSHDDAVIVEQLARLLRDKGLKVWLDQWVLVPGRPWRKGMADGLDESASCAVCVGNKAPKGWFDEEIGRALNRQTRYPDYGVIPVILPGGDSSLVDQFLDLRTWVVFKDAIDDADSLHRLISGIKNLPPGPGTDIPRVTLAPLFTVPLPENPFFTERAHELSDLQAALEKTGSFALTGLGGVGKTQTAAEYAHRRRETYAAVLWLHAEKDETLFADLAALAGSLKLPEAAAQEQQLAVAAALRWLDDNDTWLLILDNVTDLKMVEALTRKARPQRRHVIVTQKAQATGVIASQKLPKMDTDTGALLLLRRAKLIDPQQQLSDAKQKDADLARRICARVDGLPLALAQAGAYIERDQSWARQVFGVADNKVLAGDERAAAEMDLQHEPVVATFSLSLEELEEDHQAAAELLKAVAFLAPDNIPENIFTEGSEHFTPALKAAASDAFEWDKAVTTALDFSLLERNATDEDTISSPHRAGSDQVAHER